MSNAIIVRNRHHTLMVDVRLLRRIAQTLLRDLLLKEDFDLGIYLVASSEMTRLNETFLRHRGSTDVLAFDYAGKVGRASCPSHGKAAACRAEDRRDACPALLHGEILICVDEAVVQARRFRTTWPSELVRYVVHGILHLCGYDDRKAGNRRKMKRAEARLLRQLAAQFPLADLAAKPTRHRHS